MKQQTKWLANLALAVAWPAMILVAVGCDREESKADRTVSRNLSDAEVISRAMDPKTEAAIRDGATQAAAQARGSATTRRTRKEQDAAAADARSEYLAGKGEQIRADAAEALIRTAQSQSKASKPSQAVALSMLAQSHYARAVNLAAAVSEKQAVARSLLSRIQSLADGVYANSKAIEVEQATDPRKPPTTQAVSRDLAAPIDAAQRIYNNYKQRVQALDATIAQLQKTIEEKTASVADTAKRLKEAKIEASELELKSTQSKEPQSGELFRAAAAASAKAKVLEFDLTRLQDELSDRGELKLRLAEATARKQDAEAAMKPYADLIAQLESDWAASQKKIQDLRAASAAIVNGRPGAAPSLASVSGELAKVLEDAATTRNEAIKQCDEAIRSWEETERLAKQIVSDMTTRIGESETSSSKAAFESIKRAFDQDPYRVRRARALIAKANLYMGLKSMLEDRQRVQQAVGHVLAQAGLQPPKSLAIASDDISAATRSALKSLQEAEKILSNYSPTKTKPGETPDDPASGSGPTIRMDARLASIEVQWDMYSLDPKGPMAAEHLSAARTRLTALARWRESAQASRFERGFPLPRFADELEVALKPFRRGAAPPEVTSLPLPPATQPSGGTTPTPPTPTPTPPTPTPDVTPPDAASPYYKFAGPYGRREAPGSMNVPVTANRAGQLSFAGMTYKAEFVAGILADGTVVADREGVEGTDSTGTVWVSKAADIQGKQMFPFEKK